MWDLHRVDGMRLRFCGGLGILWRIYMVDGDLSALIFGGFSWFLLCVSVVYRGGGGF